VPQLRGERSRRITVCAVLAGVLLFSLAPVVRAEVLSAWAWQAQRKAAPSLLALSGIPAGDLAVAWVGQPDKITYLGIKTAQANTLRDASLQLDVDTAAPNIDVEGAQLRACLVVLEWEYAEPMGWDARPPTICETSVPGRFDAPSSSFSFSLDPLAAPLASPSVHGISIEPVEAAASSFQVVFKPDIKLTLAAPTSGAQSPRLPSDPTPIEEPVEPTTDAGNVYSSPPAVSNPTPDGASSSALAVAGPRRADGRPVTLTGVYAMLIVLAGLALGGRVLAQILRTRREDER
jgi:hypothetical protein